MTDFKSNPLQAIFEQNTEILHRLKLPNNEPKKEPERDLIYNKKQTAEYLGVHPATVTRWVNFGILKAINVGGEVKFKESEIKAFCKPYIPIKKTSIK